jgi:hypothetical protein
MEAGEKTEGVEKTGATSGKLRSWKIEREE